jgi:hypothetical protein
MFSASVDSEYKALKILKEFLGPIAVREIEKLKKQELNYDRLLKYGDNLRAKKIINENQLLDYKTKLKEVYGKTEKPEVAKLMEIAKERKEMQDVIQKIILLAYKIYGEIAIRKANAVQGLKVDYNGKVIGMERDENTILRGLGVIYIDIMGDVTRFLKTKEALNNRKLSINKKR